jgi:hypothetical protein
MHAVTTVLLEKLSPNVYPFSSSELASCLRVLIGLLVLQASFVWIPDVVRTIPNAGISPLQRLVPLICVLFSSLSAPAS